MLWFLFFFFFNDTATTEIYTRSIVGSVRCVQETALRHFYELSYTEVIRIGLSRIRTDFEEWLAPLCNHPLPVEERPALCKLLVGLKNIKLIKKFDLLYYEDMPLIIHGINQGCFEYVLANIEAIMDYMIKGKKKKKKKKKKNSEDKTQKKKKTSQKNHTNKTI
eukprot:TRINITY_DN4273_c0_g1_i2.p2 TRINITY_DN4273_c0_g1~~TRINITY_DN4273_c0_g1_i2.p2  ORF type:complete len:164 (+),score=58.53 TRINITY_DN4273_c0_g1_i2:40-531(+)